MEAIRLGEKCVPSLVVQELEKTYNEQINRLIQKQPLDYNPVKITEQILEQTKCLANEKNAKKRNGIEEHIKRLSSWLEQLPIHQEDAIYNVHQESYVAFWITGKHFFAIRHGRGGTFCVMEVTNATARTVLTHQAF